jgi:hypothetical protein
MEIEKNWCVEVWGEIENFQTELFYTRKEAEAHFKSIRKKLDSIRYIMSRDSIVDKVDDRNAIYLTDLREL